MPAPNPANNTITEIITAVKYSILPCPYGCSLSGTLLASLVPIIVIIEENESVKLFTASKIIAIEFVKIPTINLKITRNILTIIPNILVFIIILFLSIFYTSLLNKHIDIK